MHNWISFFIPSVIRGRNFLHRACKSEKSEECFLYLDYIWSFPIYRAAFAYLSVGSYNLRNCLCRWKKSAYGRNDFIRYPLFYSPVESAAISLPRGGNTKLTSQTPLLSKFTCIRRLKALDSNNIEIIRAKCLGISMCQFYVERVFVVLLFLNNRNIKQYVLSISLIFKIKNLL